MLKSSLLERIEHVVHGFGTRTSPHPVEAAWNWGDRPIWKQVHGNRCVDVLYQRQECGETDSLMTFKSKIPIAVVTADCVPILLAKKDGAGVAAIHAGWRGTIAGIVVAVWKQLSERGEKPSEWAAAIGPHICAECYEVSEELVQQFCHSFDSIKKSIVSPAPRRINLGGINEAILRGIGVDVETLAFCTLCSKESAVRAFNSYRGGDTQQRQWSAIQVCR